MLIEGKRILFFAPSFFSYDKLIAKKLEDMGAVVEHYDERPGNSFYTKAMLRVYPAALEKITNQYYNKIFSLIEGKAYDYVFVVNIEAMNLPILKKLRTACSGAQFILYMWDSAINKKSLPSFYTLFDYCFTFDRFDAENLPGMKFRPLFFIDEYNALPKTKQQYHLSFVGTAHGDRSYIVKKVKAQMNQLGLMFFCYLYLNSWKMFFFYKLTNPKFRSAGTFKDFSFTALRQEQIVKIIAELHAVLDIQHEMQTGLTMRTLEVMGAGKKLITTNVDILSYDFFNSENILIINRDNPIIDTHFFDSNYVPLPPEIRYRYSIEGWINEIFSACNTPILA